MRMCRALYPALRGMAAEAQICAVAACAEGYAFPTNLDRDPPLGGLAPESQQGLLLRALQDDWPAAQLQAALQQQADKKLTHQETPL